VSSEYDQFTPAHGTIHAIIAAYTAAFPGRLRAVYVDGSHADGSDLATSDLDLTIVFKDAWQGTEERAAIQRLSDECARAATVELDAGVVDEVELRQRGMHPTLKLASALVWGEDIRDRFAIMPHRPLGPRPHARRVLAHDPAV
jgi:predicted nucleotidyltransferase